MHFEELAYTVDGLSVRVPFHPRLTMVHLPGGEQRAAWITRLLGVLEGIRTGDGAGVACVDHAGRRIRLERDDQGGATLTDLATGAELPYSAGHLPLDGRFDWFESIGITSRTASDLIVVDDEAFTGDEEYDSHEVKAKLKEARKLLARVERQRQAAMARCRTRDDLRRAISDLDERLREEALTGTRRRKAAAAEAVTAEVAAALDSLAGACRATAKRRDELVARLDALREAEQDTKQETLRELIEDVEPAFVDALSALADGCRPFGVSIDAARLEAAGITAAGIETMAAEVLAEAAARAAEAMPEQTTPHGSRPLSEVEPPSALLAERGRLTQELQRMESGLPDVAELAERHSALEGRVAALAAAFSAGPRAINFQQAETVLLRRAVHARRVGRHREPLPLVVNDALAPFPSSDKAQLLDVVARLGETTQVVYLTGDVETLAWASAQAGTCEIIVPRPDGLATVA